MRIVFATGNAGKLKEIRRILTGTGVEVFSLKDLSLTQDAEENGETFAENAYIKTKEIFDKLSSEGLMKDTVVMADDSGITIDRFGGGPGVHSARFMGYDTSYDIKNAAIMKELEGVPDEERGCAFVCHMTAMTEDGRVFDAEDEVRGLISREAKGETGFGYDPIFFLPSFGCCIGELTEDQKNEISHRGKVLRKMRDLLISEGVL